MPLVKWERNDRGFKSYRTLTRRVEGHRLAEQRRVYREKEARQLKSAEQQKLLKEPEGIDTDKETERGRERREKREVEENAAELERLRTQVLSERESERRPTLLTNGEEEYFTDSVDHALEAAVEAERTRYRHRHRGEEMSLEDEEMFRAQWLSERMVEMAERERAKREKNEDAYHSTSEERLSPAFYATPPTVEENVRKALLNRLDEGKSTPTEQVGDVSQKKESETDAELKEEMEDGKGKEGDGDENVEKRESEESGEESVQIGEKEDESNKELVYEEKEVKDEGKGITEDESDGVLSEKDVVEGANQVDEVEEELQSPSDCLPADTVDNQDGKIDEEKEFDSIEKDEIDEVKEESDDDGAEKEESDDGGAEKEERYVAEMDSGKENEVRQEEEEGNEGREETPEQKAAAGAGDGNIEDKEKEQEEEDTIQATDFPPDFPFSTVEEWEAFAETQERRFALRQLESQIEQEVTIRERYEYQQFWNCRYSVIVTSLNILSTKQNHCRDEIIIFLNSI